MEFPSTRSALATIFHTRHSMTGSRRHKRRVVPVEVEGIPEELIRTGNEERQDVAKDKSKRTTPHKGSIMVTIKTREGLCIQKKGLDYQGLKTLVEKLEGLC